MGSRFSSVLITEGAQSSLGRMRNLRILEDYPGCDCVARKIFSSYYYGSLGKGETLGCCNFVSWFKATSTRKVASSWHQWYVAEYDTTRVYYYCESVVIDCAAQGGRRNESRIMGACLRPSLWSPVAHWVWDEKGPWPKGKYLIIQGSVTITTIFCYFILGILRKTRGNRDHAPGG